MKRMKYLLGLLVFLVIADGVLTHFLLEAGIAREGNPLLVPIVGDAGFIVLKIAGALLCAFILWDVHRRWPRVAATAAWSGVIFYAAIVVWNTSLFVPA